MSITWKDLTDDDWKLIANIIVENKNKTARYEAYASSSVGAKFPLSKTIFLALFEKPLRNYITALDSQPIDYSLLKYAYRVKLPAYSSLNEYEEAIAVIKAGKTPKQANPNNVKRSSAEKGRTISRLVLAGLIGAVVWWWVAPASDSDEALKAPYFVKAESLNVRSEPEGRVTGKLVKGEEVFISSVSGDWAELQRGGWVSREFLSLIDPSMSARPPAWMSERSSATSATGAPEKKKDVLAEFLESDFAKRNNVVFDRGWDLNTGGYTNNYDSKDTQFIAASVETRDGAVYGFSIQVLYPDDTERPIELIKTFAPDINESEAKRYLRTNLGRKVSALADAPRLPLQGGTLQAGNVAYSFGSRTVNAFYASFDLDIPIKNLSGSANKLTRDSQDYESIAAFLEQQAVAGLQADPVKVALNARYPYLKNVDRTQTYTPVKQQTIYLYYEGYPEITFWNKPGAINFGGTPVGKIQAQSPQSGEVIAHAALPGDRNYFYIYSSDEFQGWVGRPYVKTNAVGAKFYMANPITGEQFWAPDAVSTADVSRLLRTHPDRFVPAYDDIQWDSRIPQRFRREGYQMYVEALNQGYREVERLTRSYQGY
ncbi:MAG: hypothetical protein CML33_04630 [Rhodobacteraceae bacterium]|nr:hypothetical protein [Paracoccaceae bacterium]